MSREHYKNVQACSAGTFASITGLRDNNAIAEFSSWIALNIERIPQEANHLLTIETAWIMFAGK